MKLRLAVVTPQGRVRNLQVTTDATATVGDVAAALAGADPYEPGDPLDPSSMTLEVIESGGPVSVTGASAPGGMGRRVLDPALALNLSAVRSGSSVRVQQAMNTRSQDTSDAATLEIVGGPHRGQRFTLPVGSTTVIGRSDKRADIALQSDRLMSKTHLRVSVGTTVEITDLGSANGTLVGEERVHKQVVGNDDYITIGQTVFRITRTVASVHGAAMDTNDVDHVRTPRLVQRTPDITVTLPNPPSFNENPRFPIVAMVAPLLMGAVMFLVMHNFMSIIFVALSPVIMIGNWIDQRIRMNRTRRTKIAEFNAALQRANRELGEAHVAERAARLTQYPSTREYIEHAKRLGPNLWSRRPEHPEFLQLRLGLGQDVAHTQTEGGTEHAAIPEHADQIKILRAANEFIQNVPIVCNLREDGALGLEGDDSRIDDVSRATIMQLLLAHSPAEVVMAALTGPTSFERWSWLEWMPHCCSPHSPIGTLQLARDAATGTALLARLEEIIAVRSSSKTPELRGPADYEEDGGDTPTVPSIVVLVDAPQVDRKRLTRIVEQGPDVGVHVIWVSKTKHDLPAGCRCYMSCFHDEHPELPSVTFVRRSLRSPRVNPELLDAESARLLARVMAPVVDGGVPVDDDSDLPASISFITLTGHELADPPSGDEKDEQIQRWEANHSLIDREGGAQPMKKPVSLSALVGQGATGPVALDLRVHGPHALVGGTTGAGKSEFLQSWVLGMAQALSPDRVTFLFVDYKGGSAFARCTDLPHCVGLVTDLSPAMVRRALTSLRAELRYREHLLNSKGVKDLVTLEMNGDPECPPSLVIVVDEFAALVNEVPEFVDGVVDVAQRGRSLGLHLILATQRPSGVIKDNLRANTNLRVALRMADETDSMDVLGDKTAAHFPPELPGRAAAKTGPGRLTLFQSAYPGARTSREAQAVDVSVEEMTFGVPRPWQVPRAVSDSATMERDIDRVVDRIVDAAHKAGVREPRKPWQPELGTSYDLAAMDHHGDDALLLGQADDPERQWQGPAYFRPDTEANIVFYGAGGSGKSTALRTLAIAAAMNRVAGPDGTPLPGAPVDVYGIDAAGGGLSMLEPLPNVGSIIDSDDTERVMRLMKRLRDLVDERSERYSAVHADTITAYRKLARKPKEPRVLLLVDGIGAWRSELEKSTEGNEILEIFSRLLLEGRGVGVHVAATAERVGALPTTMAGAFLSKVILRQSDENDYYAFGVPKDMLSPESCPGRAIMAGSSRPQELQIAVLSGSTDVVEQARKIEEFAQFLTSAGIRVTKPEPVRSLPTLLAASEIQAVAGTGDRRLPVIGMSSETLEPATFNPEGALLVAGPPSSGRTNALCWMSTALKAWDKDIARILIATRRSTAAQRADLWDVCLEGQSLGDEELSLLEKMVSTEVEPGAPRVVLVLEDFAQYSSMSTMDRFAALVLAAVRNGHTVIAEAETSVWNMPMMGTLGYELREPRQGLLLQPDRTDADMIFKTQAPIMRGRIPAGRGFWIQKRRAAVVHLPLVLDVQD